MTSSRYHLILILLYAVAATQGDSGDDFSNNLFTDLAPILALFGERVTMQFLSQSMGWADCILLAMAPLGIITIIVSAIRVGGPPFLKALVGRSTENVHAAEMELMSSTSDEVCELWNGSDVVRCPGSAPVLDFICAMHKGIPDYVPAEIRIMELDDWKEGIVRAQKNDQAVKGSQSALNRVKLWWNGIVIGRQPTTEDIQSESDRSYIAVLYHTKNSAPNITINRADDLDRTELRLFALLGIIIQVGVLVFLALITYLPPLGHTFLKDGRQVADYAFPITASGTVFLAIGMLICAHVVDRRTSETTWNTKAGIKAQVVWLQREAIVSDQRFHSVALYREKPFSIFKKSEREKPLSIFKKSGREKLFSIFKKSEREKPFSIFKKSEREKPFSIFKKSEREKPSLEEIQIKTIIGTIVSLVGFVAQFIGIRGMHWSAPIAQLIAVALMTAIRAWVRRGLITKLNSHPLMAKHELDWFALTFGDPSGSPWYSTISTSQHPQHPQDQSEAGNNKHPPILPTREPHRTGSDVNRSLNGNANGSSNLYWIPLCITDEEQTLFYHRSRLDNEPDDEPGDGSSNSSRAENSLTFDRTTAQGLLRIRKRFANISNTKTVDWHNPMAAVARSLAEAIGMVMNTFVKSKRENYAWDFPVCCPVASQTELVSLQIHNIDGQWIIAADELEAVLSLWVYSLKRLESKRSGREHTMFPGDTSELERESSRPALRMVGLFSKEMLRDLAWWLPSDMSFISQVAHLENASQFGQVKTFPDYNIHGFTWPSREALGKHSSWEWSLLDLRAEAIQFWRKPEPLGRIEDHTKRRHFATQMAESIERLCAIDLFTSFVWATVQLKHGEIRKNLQPLTSKPPSTTKSRSWESLSFRDSALDELAHNVESTRLMTRYQAYLSIMPALSHSKVLGDTRLAVEHVRAEGVRYENSKEWEKSSAAYVSLFYLVKNSDSFESVSSQTAVALLLEYLRTNPPVEVSDFDYMCDSERWPHSRDDPIRNLLAKGRFGVSNRGMINAFNELYKRQGREDCVDSLEQALEAFTDNGSTHDSGSNADGISNLKDIGCMYDSKGQKKHDEMYPEDCCCFGFSLGLDDPLNQKDYMNWKDCMDWTPLHYESARGCSNIKHLFQLRDEDISRGMILAPDLRGLIPLHYACRNGHLETVKTLFKKARSSAYNKQGIDGTSPLHMAARSGSSDTVEFLLEEGANASLKDKNGRTALHYAAQCGHAGIVEKLRGNITQADSNGMTALHCAAQYGHADIVEKLKEHIKQADNNHRTALHYAARYGWIEVIKKIIKIDRTMVDIKDKQHSTALHLAAERGHANAVKVLLNEGADPHSESKIWRSLPIHLACTRNSIRTVEVLLGKDPDTWNKSDDNGRPPAEIAAYHGKLEVVRWLLKEWSKTYAVEDRVRAYKGVVGELRSRKYRREMGYGSGEESSEVDLGITEEEMKISEGTEGVNQGNEEGGEGDEGGDE